MYSNMQMEFMSIKPGTKVQSSVRTQYPLNGNTDGDYPNDGDRLNNLDAFEKQNYNFAIQKSPDKLLSNQQQYMEA